MKSSLFPKIKNSFSNIIKFLLFLKCINYSFCSCSIDKPFKENGICVSSCSKNDCILENKIIETQYLNNIIKIGPENNHYINIITTENNDLIYLASSYPNDNNRFLFGITKKGEGYFTIKNKKEKFNKIIIEDQETVGRFESVIFPIKLLNGNDEYLLSVSKNNQMMELYDLKTSKIYFRYLIQTFNLYNIYQKVGTILSLKNSGRNNYIIGVLSTEYLCRISNCWGYQYNLEKYQLNFFYLIKIEFSRLNINYNQPLFSMVKIGHSNNVISYSNSCDKQTCSANYNNGTQASDSPIISCYETTSFYLICFYQNIDKKYIITVYNENLEYNNQFILLTSNSIDKFFKCIHFFEITGIFAYFNNDEKQKIVFQFLDYNSNNIYNHFKEVESIIIQNYFFITNIQLNDIIKVNNKKFFYVSLSENKEILYIISINNYVEQKFSKRIYKINISNLYNYKIYSAIKLAIYNSLLSFASNYQENDLVFPSLMIFSYPNSTDIYLDLEQHLIKNNDKKINNINLQLICILENNIFGYINIGIHLYYECNAQNKIYLNDDSDSLITINSILEANGTTNITLNIEQNSIYYPFTCEIIYYCIATEPDYENYNKYNEIIGENDEEDKYYESQKQNYTGRYSNYTISLKNKLTEENCKDNCELCRVNNISNCITCNNEYYYYLEEFKLCQDKIIKEEEQEIEEEEENKEEEKENEIIEDKEEETIEEEIQFEGKEERGEFEEEEKNAEIIINEENEEEFEKNFEEENEEKIEEEFEKENEGEKEEECEEENEEEIINEENEEKITKEENEEIEEEKMEKNEEEFEEKEKKEEDFFDDCSLEGIKRNLCREKISEEKIELVYLYFIDELLNDNYKNENIMIQTKNAKFQLSLSDTQKNLQNPEFSNLDLGKCEEKIKVLFNLSESNQLIIFKLDLKNIEDSKTYVYYEVFNPVTLKRIKIEDICETDLINIYAPVLLDNESLSLISNLASFNYNLFNENDPFYNDICTKFTNGKGSDMLLIDRKNDIFNKSATQPLCQKNCEIILYNEFTQKVKCNCHIQQKEVDINLIKSVHNLKFDKKEIVESFFDAILFSNFYVMKCFHIAFNFKNIFQNIGRIIMTIILLAFITLFILYFINEEKILNNYFKFILEKKLEKHQRKKSINKYDDKNNDLKKHKHHHHHRNKDSKEKHHKNKHLEEKHKKERHKKEKQKKSEKGRVKNLKQSQKENNIINKKVHQKENNNNISFPPKNKEKIDTSKNKSLNKKKINNKFTDRFETSIDHSHSFVILDEKLRYSVIKNRYILLNEQELNNINYSQALILDKRTYCKYYWSLLREKELILFTFLNENDYNLKTIKIFLLFLSFSLYFTVNGFFFSDETMHKIYKNNGKYRIIHQIPIMVYSTLISITINLLLKKLSLTDHNILEFKQEKDFENASKKAKQILKCIKIKLAIFYSLNFLLVLFFWYFVSCFCGVYNNTQLILIKDTIISFCLSLIYPFGLNLIPGIFRISSLRAENKNKECLYKVSILIAYI